VRDLGGVFSRGIGHIQKPAAAGQWANGDKRRCQGDKSESYCKEVAQNHHPFKKRTLVEWGGVAGVKLAGHTEDNGRKKTRPIEESERGRKKPVSCIERSGAINLP